MRLFSLLASGIFVATASTALAQHATQYPLQLENCGVELTFTEAPQRAVGIGQNSSEILLLLGLADRMVGTATWVSPVLEEVAADNEKVPRLADSTASYEAILGTEPDFIAAQFGMRDEAGNREQYADLGIPSYISPTTCAMKDASNGDGVRLEPWTSELLYQEISELAAIFDVNERGAELVSELRSREAAVRAQLGKRAAGLSMVFWFSSPEIAGDAWVAGRNGASAYMMEVLGARNIVDSEEDWPLVSWEAIAAADPTVIVVGTMDRRNRPADDPAVKMEFLQTDPMVSQLSAVQADHLVLLDAQAMNPTLRTIGGLETLAEALQSQGLLQ
jgi:iron complex transport system substrate-binding protein